jgi:hypothetical protein
MHRTGGVANPYRKKLVWAALVPSKFGGRAIVGIAWMNLGSYSMYSLEQGPTLLIRLSGVGNCCAPEVAGSKLTVAFDMAPAAKGTLPLFVFTGIVGDAITESCGWSDDVVGDGFMSTSGPTAFTPSTLVRRPKS